MKYKFLTAFFALALITTSSKAGIVTAILVCGALAVYRSEERWWLAGIFGSALMAIIVGMSKLPMNDIVTSFHQRLDIWAGAKKVYDYSTWRGIGMGMFPNYYNQLKLESYSSGSWVHNDIFQIAIEMGLWASLVFVAMWVWMYLKTRPATIPAAAVLTAILAQSMVEFQFYVPAISLLGGLALAYHSIRRES